MASNEQCPQQNYRRMIHELSGGLTSSNLESILYLSGLSTTEIEVSRANLSLHVLSCLESHSLISPSKVDHLEYLLKEIHRENLLKLIQKYKESREYKDLKKKKRKSSKSTGKTASCPGAQKEDGLSNGKRKLQSLYTLLLTHITGLTQVTTILREELDKIGEEDEGVDQAMDRFLKVVEDGDKFTDDLRAVFKDMGIKSNRSSTSSDEAVETAAAVGKIVASSSPTPATSPQSSLSSKFPRKKPVPLPRGKHPKSPLVNQETGNLRQEHGSNISFEQYKHSYQASSTPKLARRDAEREEDTTAENTTGTGDSGISEWIAGCRTPEFKGDSPDPIANDEKKRYTSLLKRKFDVPDSSGYTTISHGNNLLNIPLQDDDYAHIRHTDS